MYSNQVYEGGLLNLIGEASAVSGNGDLKDPSIHTLNPSAHTYLPASTVIMSTSFQCAPQRHQHSQGSYHVRDPRITRTIRQARHSLPMLQAAKAEVHTRARGLHQLPESRFAMCVSSC